MDESEIAKQRSKELIRSGLLLDNADVINAMEKDEKPQYIPVKFTKDMVPTGESLARLEQLGKLSEHIDRLLIKMGKEMRCGNIQAKPYYKSEKDNACTYCDYFEICCFDETLGDKKRILKKFKPEEAWRIIEGGESDE